MDKKSSLISSFLSAILIFAFLYCFFTFLAECIKDVPSTSKLVYPQLIQNDSNETTIQNADIEIKYRGQIYLIHANKLYVNEE